MTTATGGQRPWLPPPRLLEILMTWFSIGIQSFGGGSTTLYLIRDACITRWLADRSRVRQRLGAGADFARHQPHQDHRGHRTPTARLARLDRGHRRPAAAERHDHRADDGRLHHHPGLAVRQGRDARRDPRHHRHQRRAGPPDGAGAAEPCAARGARQRGRATGAPGRFGAAPGRGARLAGDRAGAGGHQRDAAVGRSSRRHPAHAPSGARRARPPDESGRSDGAHRPAPLFLAVSESVSALDRRSGQPAVSAPGPHRARLGHRSRFPRRDRRRPGRAPAPTACGRSAWAISPTAGWAPGWR